MSKTGPASYGIHGPKAEPKLDGLLLLIATSPHFLNKNLIFQSPWFSAVVPNELPKCNPQALSLSCLMLLPACSGSWDIESGRIYCMHRSIQSQEKKGASEESYELGQWSCTAVDTVDVEL